MKCKYWNCNKETKNRSKFCSKKHQQIFSVSIRRKELKLKYIEYLGGKCISCGYNKCIDALEFHHKDPSKKDFGISSAGTTKSFERIKLELDKCDLLCSNCHKEIHSNKTILSEVFLKRKKRAETLQETPKLCKCGKQIPKRQKFCSQICRHKFTRKRPTKDQLIKDFEILKSFVQVGLKYDVTDNAVRKWCISYNLSSKVKRKSRPQIL